MPSSSLPANLPRPRDEATSARDEVNGPSSSWPRLFDAALLLSFLGLTFLLGVFLLKDTDFWWHLRTGDMVRQQGRVPRTDPFVYGVPDRPWIDLHWVFQVAISWLHERGGVPALTLAKCAVTTLAVLLLISAKRREWPLWAMLLAWLPALLVLGGRMYVRPETLTLLYLSIYLAVLFRIDRKPWLVMVLPLVQAAWVNTQGLFVLGPVLLAMALADAALRPGSLAPSKGRWWRTVLAGAVLTGLACLVNPYGLAGALYPLELARTMSNPIFSLNIAELTPVPVFLARDRGIVSLPMWLHFATLVVGALSFLGPLAWRVFVRLRPGPEVEAGPEARSVKAGKSRKGRAARAPRSSRKAKAVDAPTEAGWRPSVFRLLLFAGFSVLSMRATRNSHQFAAVVGTVTAWNLGEWAYAVRSRAASRGGAGGQAVVPRLATLALLLGVVTWVASGSYYAAAREGRVIGLDEQPLWFPHEAVKFAGMEGMPPRFLSYHIGHASLYDYYHGPGRKVFADARLEVIGPELFERYMTLERRIVDDAPGWSRELDAIGRPVVLADHEMNASVSARLLASADWRCVWFDPIAAVFVHAAHDEIVRRYQVDFAGRHFRPGPETEPRGADALLASARGIRNIASLLPPGGPGRAGLVLLGMAHARRYEQALPGVADGWKMLGQLEMLRDVSSVQPAPRFRMPFDPVLDLSTVRSTHALKRALEATPDDFSTLLMLERAFETRGMTEAAVPLLERLVGLTAVNRIQVQTQAQAAASLAAGRAALGPEPAPAWQNLDELRGIVSDLLARGRARSAALYLEKASPAESRPWDETDRIATLWLHLGEPARAREVWLGASGLPSSGPGVRLARVAVTHLVEGRFEAARRSFDEALAAGPDLFEAHYGRAILEQDAGRAGEALAAARRAEASAPSDWARSAARGVVSLVTPYAVPPLAEGR